jgi:multiple antibiotic resistance protein
MNSGVDDVRVAGGLILLVFAIYDLLFSREQRKEPLGAMIEDTGPAGEVGLVPLGVPMLVGPATLAAVLFISEVHGVLVACLALLINGLVNVVILLGGASLMNVVGRGVVRTVGKVFGLLLAAMAVSMIRMGVSNMWPAP